MSRPAPNIIWSTPPGCRLTNELTSYTCEDMCMHSSDQLCLLCHGACKVKFAREYLSSNSDMSVVPSIKFAQLPPGEFFTLGPFQVAIRRLVGFHHLIDR